MSLRCCLLHLPLPPLRCRCRWEVPAAPCSTCTAAVLTYLSPPCPAQPLATPPSPIHPVVPPAYAMLDPDRSLSLGQTMALIFPPDDAKGACGGCGGWLA